MDTFRRAMTVATIPMIIVLPFWLIIGRSLLDVTGWFTLILFFTLIPVLIVLLIVLAVLLRTRKDVKSTGRISGRDAILLAGFYGSTFLYGFFLLDADDNISNISSVATKLFGRQFKGASDFLSLVFFCSMIVLGITCLIVFISERVKQSKQT